MPLGYVCELESGGCGSSRLRKWQGRCPHCGGLYHCKQTIVAGEEPSGGRSELLGGVHSLNRIEAVNLERISTGFSGIDQILGTDRVTGESGIAALAGHAIQLIGAPGAGKSTLLLQICRHITKAHHRVLYVAGEESLASIKARADRVGHFPAAMLIKDETDLDRIFYAVDETSPEILVVDSLQTVTVEGYAVGSQSATVIAARDLSRLCAKRQVGLVLVNQINKAGDDFSGPKQVEHTVDTSLFLQLLPDRVTRVLECNSKNRHGKTPAEQYLEMCEEGLYEIERDPDEPAERAGEEASPRRGARLRGH